MKHEKPGDRWDHLVHPEVLLENLLEERKGLSFPSPKLKCNSGERAGSFSQRTGNEWTLMSQTKETFLLT